MDDLSELIKSISSDEQSMAKIKALASGLISSELAEKPSPKSTPPQDDGDSAFSAADMKKIMSLMGAFNSGENDDRAALLVSLRPHLSEKRRERVDSAVKILRLIKLMPLLKEFG